jgi:uncharacterized membrane protein YcfT
MWEALEQTGWVQTMGSTGWMYSTISVTHYVAMFWFIGSIAMVDLRVMGVAGRNRSVGELAQQLFPWAWVGFTLATISGFLMFATAAGDWAPSKHFHYKLALIALSVVFAVVVQRFAPKWSETPETSSIAKIIALVSLLLWIATIVMASEIPSLEGLG